MRILFDALIATEKPFGYVSVIAEYLNRMNRYLQAKGTRDIEFVVVCQQRALGQIDPRSELANSGRFVIKAVPNLKNVLIRAIYEQVMVNLLALRHRCDVIHMPASLGLVWALRKQVLFFHATTTFMLERRMHGRGRIPTALHNLVIEMSTKHADVLAISTETTARELFSHFGFKRPYHVIGEGIKDFADVCGHPSDGIVASLSGRKFLLFTSSFYELKNQKLLIDLFNQRVDGKLLLVLVGSGIQRDYFNQCLAAKGENVLILEDVDDPTLRWLYENAALYISPSLFEGFSMTPLESLLCNRPILLSDIPVHREVYGAGFHYFNPREVRGLKEIVEEALSQEYRNKCLALRSGLLEKYLWPGFLEKNLELYRQALGARGSGDR